MRRPRRRRLIRTGLGLAALALAGALVWAVVTATNSPINVAIIGRNAPLVAADDGGGDLWVGLAFSGGGTRASAFGWGMLTELRAMTETAEDADGILSDVRLVTGVSGGAVTAAWFGLRGPEGLDTFRDAYLAKNAEAYMSVSAWNPMTLARVLAGGGNGRGTFARFLDDALFHGATFADLADRRITTWINATDIANNVTFTFLPETFDALCSDLSRLPVSEAVAASAAFPIVFAPVVLKARQGTCDYAEPAWLTTARFNPEASSAMKAYGRALASYADPAKVKFLKLLDGGITDNFGTTGFAVERARADVPYAPLTAQQAVHMSRLLFLVADAGVERQYGWTQRQSGPAGTQLGILIARAAMASATRSGYDALRLELGAWQRDLVDWRCRLPADQVVSLRGSLDGWDCRNVKLFAGQISFEDVDAALKDRLDRVPTRLRLSPEDVDLVVQAARQATRGSPELNGFLRSSRALPLPDATGEGPRRIVPLSKR